MRRTLAVAAVAAGLLAVAACDSGGGESTQDVCDRVDAEAWPAFERFEQAALDINAAHQQDDQAAVLTGVAEAQNAVSDAVDVLRDGASEAEDEELSAALETAADEFEAFIEGLDVNRVTAGEVPDTTGVDNAFQRVNDVCASAA